MGRKRTLANVSFTSTPNTAKDYGLTWTAARITGDEGNRTDKPGQRPRNSSRTGDLRLGKPVGDRAELSPVTRRISPIEVLMNVNIYIVQCLTHGW